MTNFICPFSFCKFNDNSAQNGGDCKFKGEINLIAHFDVLHTGKDVMECPEFISIEEE